MEQNFSSDFSENNATTGANAYSDSGMNGGASTAVKDNLNNVKNKVGQQASELKDKLGEQAKNYGTQLTQKVDAARGKTSAGLRTTSQKISNLALYLEEHNAQDMSETVVRTSKELVRKNPGKSLIAGLVVGMLIGRIFAMGGSHNR